MHLSAVGYRRKANVEQHRIQSDYDTMPRKPKTPRNHTLKKRKLLLLLLGSALAGGVLCAMCLRVTPTRSSTIASSQAVPFRHLRPSPATFRPQSHRRSHLPIDGPIAGPIYRVNLGTVNASLNDSDRNPEFGFRCAVISRPHTTNPQCPGYATRHNLTIRNPRPCLNGY